MSLRAIALGYVHSFHMTSMNLSDFLDNALFYDVCFFPGCLILRPLYECWDLRCILLAPFESLFSTCVIQQQLSVIFEFTKYILVTTDLHSEISRVMLKDTKWMVSCEDNAEGLIRFLYISIKVFEN